MDWLKHPDRSAEPGGRILFAVSAVLSEPLAKALRQVKGLCLKGEERTAPMKRFRLLLIQVAGRMNRNNCF